MKTLCLRMWVLTIWILPQILGVADRTLLLQKVELLLLPFTLNPDWRICLVERKYICMLETQYTGHSFNIATWVVSFSGLKISCSIRTVLEATINNSAFEFAVSTQLYNYPELYQQSQTQME